MSIFEGIKRWVFLVLYVSRSETQWRRVPIILCAPLTRTGLVEWRTLHAARANRVTKFVRLRLLRRLDLKSDVWKRFGFPHVKEGEKGTGRQTNNMQALPVFCRIKHPNVKSTQEHTFEDSRLSQQPKVQRIHTGLRIGPNLYTPPAFFHLI